MKDCLAAMLVSAGAPGLQCLENEEIVNRWQMRMEGDVVSCLAWI
jgi:hypothetical protein